MHSISPTNLRDTARNQKSIGFRWANNPVRLQYLLFFMLFFALSVVNLATWTSSSRDMDCEQFQAPCLGLFNNYNQGDVSLSDVSIPECFQFGLAGIEGSSSVQIFEDFPLSGSNTCKCSSDSRGQTPTFRVRLAESLKRPICFTPTIPFQNFCSELVVLWNKSKSLRPPDHLKPLLTIVLII